LIPIAIPKTSARSQADGNFGKKIQYIIDKWRIGFSWGLPSHVG
jgi:hypothetical protein